MAILIAAATAVDVQAMTVALIAQLERLRSVWVERGIPILQHLQPGLSDEVINEQMSALGLHVPEELRTWFGWHNGVAAEVPQYAAQPGPSVRYCSLSEAANFYNVRRAAFAKLDPSFIVDDWQREWFPICYGTSPQIIAVDCSPKFGVETPVRVLDWHHEEVKTPKAASLADMVAIWLRAWDSGAYTFDQASRDWHYDWEVLPLEIDLSRLT